MRYKILSGDRIIYDSLDKYAYPCIEPELNLELGEAGSLSFVLLPGHPMRNVMREMQTFVSAYQDDETDPIFYGRVLIAEEDLMGRLDLTCEGALTFLLDSEMEPGTYNETISDFFARCVTAHNSLVEEAKQFEVGVVDHDDAEKTMEFKLEGYNQTRSVLDSLLVKKHGGFLNVRYEGGHRYLDFIQVFRKITNQPIRTGYNLKNVQKRTNGENVFTILRPLGKDDLTIENASVSNMLNSLTLESGKYLTEDEEDPGTVIEVDDADWCYTDDYISVEADSTYTTGPSPIKAIFYDENYDYLYMIDDVSETSALHYLHTSDDTAYIKLAFKEEYASEQQLHEGKRPILTKFDAGSKMIILPERRAKYGQIIHTERFSEITTAQELYEEAIKWLSRRYATLPISIDCGIVDMHLLNPNVKSFEVGTVYDSIEDFANEIMTICSLKRDMENPANDQLTLKNMAELFGTDGGGGAGGTMSSKYAKSKK